MTGQSNPLSLNPNPAPKRGHVNKFYRHYKGKKLGPYYVRRWKINGRLHKEYIKPKDVERVKAECQAHRQKQKEISNFLTNFNFLGNCLNRYDTGKIVTQAMEAYIRRIYHEGPYISGKPQMRRKVTRELVTVDGKQMIKKTVLELDGTTNVFMVPFLANRLKPSIFQDVLAGNFDRLTSFVEEIWEEVHGKRPDADRGPSGPLSNAWLQPAS